MPAKSTQLLNLLKELLRGMGVASNQSRDMFRPWSEKSRRRLGPTAGRSGQVAVYGLVISAHFMGAIQAKNWWGATPRRCQIPGYFYATAKWASKHIWLSCRFIQAN